MSVEYLGEVTIGAMLPGVVAPLAAAMADLQGRINALLGFQTTVSLDLRALIALSASVTASLTAAVTAAPTIGLQIKVVADALLVLQLQLQIILALYGLLATSGLHAYVYDGTVADFGPEMTAALSAGLPGGSGGAQHCNALVLAATSAATWAAMGQVFKVTP
jgi:hypothetical protein